MQGVVMRRFQKLVAVAAPVIIAAAGINAGSATAATRSAPLTMLQWQAEIGQVPAAGSGCFHASFPLLTWQAAQCSTAPAPPLAPSGNGAPETVGNGHDYSAVVSGTISKATGTFTNVSSKITEKGKIDNSGAEKANEFSLQLNTQFFSGSPACAGASNPSNCLAWQQFVYTTSPNIVFMQYWLIDYNNACPSGWFTYSSDCYTNSAETKLSGTALTAKSLATLSLTGSAKAGTDEVELINGGKATLATGKDNKIDLAAHWNTTEWDLFGDAGGGEAFFGKNTTIEAVTTITATSSAAPSCVVNGFTAETNNLSLAATPALGSATSPTIGTKQTNGTTGTASCAVAS
jgi:hypothetical protein